MLFDKITSLFLFTLAVETRDADPMPNGYRMVGLHHPFKLARIVSIYDRYRAGSLSEHLLLNYVGKFVELGIIGDVLVQVERGGSRKTSRISSKTIRASRENLLMLGRTRSCPIIPEEELKDGARREYAFEVDPYTLNAHIQKYLAYWRRNLSEPLWENPFSSEKQLDAVIEKIAQLIHETGRMEFILDANSFADYLGTIGFYDTNRWDVLAALLFLREEGELEILGIEQISNNPLAFPVRISVSLRFMKKYEAKVVRAEAKSPNPNTIRVELGKGSTVFMNWKLLLSREELYKILFREIFTSSDRMTEMALAFDTFIVALRDTGLAEKVKDPDKFVRNCVTYVNKVVNSKFWYRNFLRTSERTILINPLYKAKLVKKKVSE